MIGFEPMTYRIWVCCSCPLSYISIWSRVRKSDPHYFSLEGRYHTIRRTLHCVVGRDSNPLTARPIRQFVFRLDLQSSAVTYPIIFVAYLGIEPSSSGLPSSEFCVSADLHSNRKNLFAIQLNPECGFHFCLSPTLSYADKSVCVHHLLNL